jgi:hypothetical protein
LNQNFQADFFNWIEQGIVQPRPERPPYQPQNVPSILVLPHVSLQPEVLDNDGWKEIVDPTISHHRGWPNFPLPPPPPPVNPNSKISPAHSHVQSSHARKQLKIEDHDVHEKGKDVDSPSSPSSDPTKSGSSHMHLRDDCSHVISEINPQGSTQPKAITRKSKGDNNDKGRIASQSGKYEF